MAPTKSACCSPEPVSKIPAGVRINCRKYLLLSKPASKNCSGQLLWHTNRSLVDYRQLRERPDYLLWGSLAVAMIGLSWTLAFIVLSALVVWRIACRADTHFCTGGFFLATTSARRELKEKAPFSALRIILAFSAMALLGALAG